MRQLFLVTTLVSVKIPEGYSPESAVGTVELAAGDAFRDSERLSAEVRHIAVHVMPEGYEIIVEEPDEGDE